MVLVLCSCNLLIAEEKKHKLTELKTGLDEAESLVCISYLIVQSLILFLLHEGLFLNASYLLSVVGRLRPLLSCLDLVLSLSILYFWNYLWASFLRICMSRFLPDKKRLNLVWTEDFKFLVQMIDLTSWLCRSGAWIWRPEAYPQLRKPTYWPSWENISLIWPTWSETWRSHLQLMLRLLEMIFLSLGWVIISTYASTNSSPLDHLPCPSVVSLLIALFHVHFLIWCSLLRLSLLDFKSCHVCQIRPPYQASFAVDVSARCLHCIGLIAQN